MSLRPGAPYADRVENDGQVLIYERHDFPRDAGAPDPKIIDQPMHTSAGKLTENGRFFEAAHQYKAGARPPERVRVYEKLRNGLFELVDAWIEQVDKRKVFKFKLELCADEASSEFQLNSTSQLEHTRVIPTSVKLEVWKRDQGRCRECGSTDNLHFDHIIPYSKGGSSLTAENIQLLCARHNFMKHDLIE